jgi:ribosome maturation factor RimP
MSTVVETPDAYELASLDLVVTACRQGRYAVVLELRSPTVEWTLASERSFALTAGTDFHAVAGQPVHLIRARKSDGTLEVTIGTNATLTVDGDADYEAWQLHSRDGDRLVAIPGGGVAVWTARP